jgi:hypothetical protein
MEIIPFMPFTLKEQAVVTHRFLLELNKRLKQPVRLTKDVDRHSEIPFFNTREMCTTLAEQEFDRESGAQRRGREDRDGVRGRLQTGRGVGG